MAVGIFFDAVKIDGSLRPSVLAPECECRDRTMRDIYPLRNKPSPVASVAFPHCLVVSQMTRSSRLAITS